MAPHIKGKIKKTLSSLAGQSAQSLFPDLFQNESAKVESSTVIAPPPPDMSWLAHADFGEQQERAGNAPPALLVLGGNPQQELIAQQLARMGYAVTAASSATQALERLGATKYRLVFCGADAAFEEVRRFVNQLTSDLRRHTYFVLVGADLHTLYDLEALALSANLVINDRDLPALELILDKGLRDYEQLFRPLLDILGSAP